MQAVHEARDGDMHYRDVAKKHGVAPKWVLNVWAGRRRSSTTGEPNNDTKRPRHDRKPLAEGRAGVGLTDEQLGDLFHETNDRRVRWLVLHAIQLRNVIREHIE